MEDEDEDEMKMEMKMEMEMKVKMEDGRFAIGNPPWRSGNAGNAGKTGNTGKNKVIRYSKMPKKLPIGERRPHLINIIKNFPESPPPTLCCIIKKTARDCGIAPLQAPTTPGFWLLLLLCLRIFWFLDQLLR
ncbi:hypothetical protein ASPZODRAFT_19809 [Penicilliopsis zonata CBS 506.65]|uniref:Uncharacterized protein n=1 Tax=Penicilliopsis zonata CBS 506.65 TaxID=1073090 RepID=A0A1L9S7G9_9EURO|nr:hypothetical protein ASPZODRAFT_19809 [Penicilliopsis zonata CBS 506.65]OJJ43117.1 hypothetical protein ASPZODRAFT_19809 [Penicilliopsis zonata CBS 506.65]